MGTFKSSELRAMGFRLPGDAPPKKPRRWPGTGKFAERKRWDLEQQRKPGLFLPLRVLNEANQRDSVWDVAKRASEARGLVKLMLKLNGATLPATITLTRYGPRTLDDDGLSRSLKAVRDGVADVFGVDDGDPRYDWQYRQEKAKHYGIRIEIEPKQ